MTIGSRYAATFLMLGLNIRDDGSIFLDDVLPDLDGTVYLEGTANQDGSLVIEDEAQD